VDRIPVRLVSMARLPGVAEAASTDQSALQRKGQRMQLWRRMVQRSRPAAVAEAA
jgi:hypothetical protein